MWNIKHTCACSWCKAWASFNTEARIKCKITENLTCLIDKIYEKLKKKIACSLCHACASFYTEPTHCLKHEINICTII